MNPADDPNSSHTHGLPISTPQINFLPSAPSLSSGLSFQAISAGQTSVSSLRSSVQLGGNTIPISEQKPQNEPVFNNPFISAKSGSSIFGGRSGAQNKESNETAPGSNFNPITNQTRGSITLGSSEENINSDVSSEASVVTTKYNFPIGAGFGGSGSSAHRFAEGSQVPGGSRTSLMFRHSAESQKEKSLPDDLLPQTTDKDHLKNENSTELSRQAVLNSQSKDRIRSILMENDTEDNDGEILVLNEEKESLGRSGHRRVTSQIQLSGTSPEIGDISPDKLSKEDRSIYFLLPNDSLKKEAVRAHFSKYGRVTRVILNLSRNCCTVSFARHEDAAKAYQDGGTIDGCAVRIFWRNMSRAKKKIEGVKETKQKVGKQGLLRVLEVDPEVQEELEAMGSLKKYTPLQPSQSSKDPPAPPKRLSRIKTVSNSSTKDGLLSKTESSSREAEIAVHEKKSDGDPSEVLIDGAAGTEELIAVMRTPTTSLENRLQVLEARDKLIRLRQVKQYDLSKAKKTVGVCPDMCPEKERLLRETRRQVSLYEADSKGSGMNPALAVKQYARSSADQEEPLPHELRPLPVMAMTMSYLLHCIVDLCDRPGENLAEWYHFLWDRTRSIRKEITQQELCDLDSVQLVEQCARFHIHCCARLVAEDVSVFDSRINTENLTKCLQTLKHMYYDLWVKHNEKCPNESEFMSYFLLLNLNSGTVMWELEQLREDVVQTPEINYAAKLYMAVNSNNFVRFFRLVRSAPYLSSCLAIRYFYQVRTLALRTHIKAFNARDRPILYPLASLVSDLAFEDYNEAERFCQHHGLPVDSSQSDAPQVMFSRNTFRIATTVFPQSRAHSLVERKRNCSVGQVIAGGTLPLRTFENHVPHDSFDKNGLLHPGAWEACDQGLPPSDPASLIRSSAMSTDDSSKQPRQTDSKLQSSSSAQKQAALPANETVAMGILTSAPPEAKEGPPARAEAMQLTPSKPLAAAAIVSSVPPVPSIPQSRLTFPNSSLTPPQMPSPFMVATKSSSNDRETTTVAQPPASRFEPVSNSFSFSVTQTQSTQSTPIFGSSINVPAPAFKTQNLAVQQTPSTQSTSIFGAATAFPAPAFATQSSAVQQTQSTPSTSIFGAATTFPAPVFAMQNSAVQQSQGTQSTSIFGASIASPAPAFRTQNSAVHQTQSTQSTSIFGAPTAFPVPKTQSSAVQQTGSTQNTSIFGVPTAVPAFTFKTPNSAGQLGFAPPADDLPNPFQSAAVATPAALDKQVAGKQLQFGAASPAASQSQTPGFLKPVFGSSSGNMFAASTAVGSMGAKVESHREFSSSGKVAVQSPQQDSEMEEQMRARLLENHVTRVSLECWERLISAEIREAAEESVREAAKEEKELRIKLAEDLCETMLDEVVFVELKKAASEMICKAVQEEREKELRRLASKYFKTWVEKTRLSLVRKKAIQNFPAGVIHLSLEEHANRWGGPSLELIQDFIKKDELHLQRAPKLLHSWNSLASLVGRQVMHRYHEQCSQLRWKHSAHVTFKAILSVSSNRADRSVQVTEWFVRNPQQLKEPGAIFDDHYKGVIQYVNSHQVTRDQIVASCLQLVQGNEPLSSGSYPSIAAGASAVLFSMNLSEDLVPCIERLNALVEAMAALPPPPLVIAVFGDESGLDAETLKSLIFDLGLRRKLDKGVISDYKILYLKTSSDLRTVDSEFTKVLSYTAQKWRPPTQYAVKPLRSVLMGAFDMFFISLKCNFDRGLPNSQSINNPEVLSELSNELLKHTSSVLRQAYRESELVCAREMWPIIYKGACRCFYKNSSYERHLIEILSSMRVPKVNGWPPKSLEDFDEWVRQHKKLLSQSMDQIQQIKQDWPQVFDGTSWIAVLKDCFEKTCLNINLSKLCGEELYVVINSKRLEKLHNDPWWKHSKRLRLYLRKLEKPVEELSYSDENRSNSNELGRPSKRRCVDNGTLNELVPNIEEIKRLLEGDNEMLSDETASEFEDDKGVKDRKMSKFETMIDSLQSRLGIGPYSSSKAEVDEKVENKKPRQPPEPEITKSQENKCDIIMETETPTEEEDSVQPSEESGSRMKDILETARQIINPLQLSSLGFVPSKYRERVRGYMLGTRQGDNEAVKMSFNELCRSDFVQKSQQEVEQRIHSYKRSISEEEENQSRKDQESPSSEVASSTQSSTIESQRDTFADNTANESGRSRESFAASEEKYSLSSGDGVMSVRSENSVSYDSVESVRSESSVGNESVKSVSSSNYNESSVEYEDLQVLQPYSSDIEAEEYRYEEDQGDEEMREAGEEAEEESAGDYSRSDVRATDEEVEAEDCEYSETEQIDDDEEPSVVECHLNTSGNTEDLVSEEELSRHSSSSESYSASSDEVVFDDG